MTVSIEVVEDPARACAAMMLSAAIGGGQIVLTGGSTPRVAYERFAADVRDVGLDLSSVTFWWGDERCVEPEDARSNFRMARESLLDPLTGVTEPIIRRMRSELGPERGAADYERTLRYAGPPIFDLVLLGIGPDGHCASLFPHQDTLAERTRLAVGVAEAGLEPFVSRVSLTFTALAGSRRILILAEGESKADAIGKAFGPGAGPDPAVPSSLLAPLGTDITLLIDRAAASGLGSGGAG
ncbi:MAG: 6-phosphogluconolactonase [Solirubrobacteraceae bacterium]